MISPAYLGRRGRERERKRERKKKREREKAREKKKEREREKERKREREGGRERRREREREQAPRGASVGERVSEDSARAFVSTRTAKEDNKGSMQYARRLPIAAATEDAVIAHAARLKLRDTMNLVGNIYFEASTPSQPWTAAARP